MARACKYCILMRGLKGGEIKDLPQTDEEFCNHVEGEHHIPVRRENETKSQALKRFKKENPEAGGPNCKCPACNKDAHRMAQAAMTMTGAIK